MNSNPALDFQDRTNEPVPVSFQFFESNTCHQLRPDMAATHSDEFKRDAVQIAQTISLTKRQVASDSGIGLSTFNNWVKMVSDKAGLPDPDKNLLRENEWLRRENQIPKQERDLLKKSVIICAVGFKTMVIPVLRGPKAVKFVSLCCDCRILAKTRACRVIGVTDRGLRTRKHGLVSQRQRRAMVLLAQSRDRHRSCLRSFGRSWMSEGLNEQGL